MFGFVKPVSPSPLARSDWSAVIAALCFHSSTPNARGKPAPYTVMDSRPSRLINAYDGSEYEHLMDASAFSVDTPLLDVQPNGTNDVRTITDRPPTHTAVSHVSDTHAN